MITNGSVHSQNSKIDQVKLRKYFDEIIISDEVGIKKPDKQIFELVLEGLKVKPEFSLFVGDHPLNDIKGASEVGMHAVWFEGFNRWDASEEEPKNKINRLTEIKEILKDISKKSRNI